MNTARGKYTIQTIIVIIILVLINGLAKEFNTFIDLTEEKRFTLTSSSSEMLEDIDDIVFLEILLEGDLTSSFNRLKDRTEEIVKQFRGVNPLIEYTFIDPSDGTVQEVNTIRENLGKDGIFPTNLFVMEGSQRVEKTHLSIYHC